MPTKDPIYYKRLIESIMDDDDDDDMPVADRKDVAKARIRQILRSVSNVPPLLGYVDQGFDLDPDGNFSIMVERFYATPAMRIRLDGLGLQAVTFLFTIEDGAAECNGALRLTTDAEEGDDTDCYETREFHLGVGQLVGWLLGVSAVTDFKHNDWYDPPTDLYVQSPRYRTDFAETMAPFLPILEKADPDELGELAAVAKQR